MAESDVTPILSMDDEKDEKEDIPDSDRFREVPPPYSEIESADDQTVKQVNAWKNCFIRLEKKLKPQCMSQRWGQFSKGISLFRCASIS